MRWRNFRLTIARLMIAVLIAGVILSFAAATWNEYRRRIRVQQAEAACKQAQLIREVAEYAVFEFDEGIRQPASIGIGPQSISLAGINFNPVHDAERTELLNKIMARPSGMTTARTPEELAHAKEFESLRRDVTQARAEEQAWIHELKKEQQRRIWPFRF